MNSVNRDPEGREGDWYQVDLRMYCFQESEPDSRPPPVSLLPPKAPPISAPLVGMFTFTIPQSDPLGLHQDAHDTRHTTRMSSLRSRQSRESFTRAT